VFVEMFGFVRVYGCGYEIRKNVGITCGLLNEWNMKRICRFSHVIETESEKNGVEYKIQLNSVEYEWISALVQGWLTPIDSLPSNDDIESMFKTNQYQNTFCTTPPILTLHSNDPLLDRILNENNGTGVVESIQLIPPLNSDALQLNRICIESPTVSRFDSKTTYLSCMCASLLVSGENRADVIENEGILYANYIQSKECGDVLVQGLIKVEDFEETSQQKWIQSGIHSVKALVSAGKADSLSVLVTNSKMNSVFEMLIHDSIEEFQQNGFLNTQVIVVLYRNPISKHDQTHHSIQSLMNSYDTWQWNPAFLKNHPIHVLLPAPTLLALNFNRIIPEWIPNCSRLNEAWRT